MRRLRSSRRHDRARLTPLRYAQWASVLLASVLCLTALPGTAHACKWLDGSLQAGGILAPERNHPRCDAALAAAESGTS
jgi:hypothetical protein